MSSFFIQKYFYFFKIPSFELNVIQKANHKQVDENCQFHCSDVMQCLYKLYIINKFYCDKMYFFVYCILFNVD